eukprot:COSAG05_NODE_195_length_14550_cov_203.233686_9_plen_63_part_00
MNAILPMFCKCNSVNATAIAMLFLYWRRYVESLETAAERADAVIAASRRLLREASCPPVITL